MRYVINSGIDVQKLVEIEINDCSYIMFCEIYNCLDMINICYPYAKNRENINYFNKIAELVQ